LDGGSRVSGLLVMGFEVYDFGFKIHQGIRFRTEGRGLMVQSLWCNGEGFKVKGVGFGV